MRLSLTTKIMLLCTSFLIPTAFLMYIAVSAFGVHISFATNEQLGAEYLRHLHQALSATYTSKISVNDPDRRAQAIESLLQQKAKMVDLYPQYSEALKLSESELSARGRSGNGVEKLSDRIELYTKQLHAGEREESFKSYDAIVSQIGVLTTHIGDTSNLILDPDLDSYYLMDLFLIAIPATELRATTLVEGEIGLGDRKTLTSEERMSAKTTAAILKDVDLARMKADLDTALIEDKNFFGVNDTLQNNVKQLASDSDDLLLPIVEELESRSSTGSVNKNLLPMIAAMIDSYGELWSSTNRAMHELLGARIAHNRGLQRTNLAISAVFLLALFVVGWFVSRQIVTRISQVALQVTTQTAEVAESSNQINKAAQSLSNSTTQQSAAIEETVASTEQMTAMLSQTGQSADHSLDISRESLQRAGSAQEVIARLGQAMQDIEASNKKLEELVSVIGGIQSKTKVINDIVFETRLLSVNASIEAARAGVHGKGFAVVAEEVGKLAAMSGKAASEINELLATSSKQVKEIVDETKTRVSSGVQVANEAANDFHSITELLGGIGEAIEKIVSATKEQEVGIKQTNQAMSEMDAVTQQNSQNAQNLSQLSEKINGSSTQLKSSSDEMKTLLYGT